MGNYNDLEVAVIGMAGRFPQSDDIEIFWGNLKNGKELISFFTDDELREAGVSDDILNNPNYIRANGYLSNNDCFDAAFFGYTPEDAEIMDPQMRLFYECSWKALEDAGYVPGRYKGLIGVYAGASLNFEWGFANYLKGNTSWDNSLIIDKDHLATRISYKLDLRGPSSTIYTACSTSLVAINLACTGILTGQCNIAIAGGVTIRPEKLGYVYQEGMINSPDGHNRTFDEKAGGTINGSGIGIVVLKRLQEAIEDGDNIYAIIKGSAINNDGNRKVGFTAPSIEGQAEVIRAAMLMAEIKPESISFVECHGTATNIGDPVEVEGLKLAFNTDKRNFCAIGSVKSNVGHLDSAAGVTGFIKAALCLKHKMLVPSLHYKNPNPKIDFKNSPFYVNTETKEWINPNYPLRAGVTALGVGGTNAYTILEEAPELELSSKSRDNKLILISGKTKTAADSNLDNFLAYVQKHQEINLADAAFTLQVGRQHFSHRRMFICKNVDTCLKAIDNKVIIKSRVHKEGKKKVVFMFSGQGAQYVNMGRGLYENEKYFRDHVDKCSEILKKRLGFDIRDILYPEQKQVNDAEKKIDQVLYAQPLKFTIEYSLAKLLINFGINPDYMIGHSFGEIVAACLSGVFTLEDALEVVALRGELMESAEAGLMMSVNMSEAIVADYIKKYNNVSLAAVNADDLCIVSGSIKDVIAFEQEIKNDGYNTVMLKVPRAGHSNMMNPIMDQFSHRISQMTLNEPQIPYISGLSGDWIKNNEAISGEYWSRHLKETIRFSDGIDALLKKGDAIFIQLGPDKGLVSFVELHNDSQHSANGINLIRHRKDIIDDQEYFSNQIGSLWLNGVEIDWWKYYEGEKRKRISLPTYAFDKLKFESKANLNELLNQGFFVKQGIKRKENISDWFYLPIWEQAPEPSHSLFNESANWLIFTDFIGVGEKIASELIGKNQNVIQVSPGASFANINNNKFIVNRELPSDYEKIFIELKNINQIPHKIIYLWNLSGQENTEDIYYRTKEAKDNGLYGLTYVAKAIGNLNLTEDINIISVTNNMSRVIGNEQIFPEKALILGVIKIIPFEYANIKCKNIDVVDNDLGASSIDIINEAGIDCSNQLVAYRNNIRWIERLKPVKIANVTTDRLKKKGFYIILGGTNEVALKIAEYLGKEYQAKVVLIDKISFVEKNLWGKWLEEYGRNNETSKKILKLNEIESAGGSLNYINCDISKFTETESVFKKLISKYGNINGIIDSDITGTNPVLIQYLNKQDNESLLTTKIEGTLNLLAIIEKQNIDFIVFFSSLNGLLGKIGEINHAAYDGFVANLAMAINKKNNIAAATINWTGWSERDSEIENIQDKNAINPEEAIEVFKRALGNNFGRIAISTIDVNEINNLSTSNSGQIMIDPSEEISIELYPRPENCPDYIEPESEIEKKVAEIWSRFFKFEKIGVNDNFFMLGGDSLKALRLFALLHKEFGVRMEVKEIFKRPTVSSISEYLNQNMEEVLI